MPYRLNEPTASLRKIPFEMYDSSGNPLTGSTLTFTNPPAAGEVQVSKAGGAYTDVTGSISEVGAGSWDYNGVLGDFDTLGRIRLKVNKTGAQLFKYEDTVSAVQRTFSAGSIGYAALNETRRVLFSTLNVNGEAQNADSLPTIVVYEQGTSIAGGSPVVANKATGLYEVTLVLTTANGFSAFKEYTVAAVVVIDGSTSRTPVASLLLEPPIVRGQTSGVPTTTVIPTTITVASADYYKDAWLHIEDGALAGQVKRIGAMTVGGQITLAATYAFSAAPAAGVNVRIINR